MTAYDQFDPFEQRITAAIDDIAAPRRPDYLDDILRQTGRSSQRPRWSFPGRWLPMDTTLSPTRGLGQFSAVPVIALLIALLLATIALIAVVGSGDRSAPPSGPAANGQIVYAGGVDDVYVLDTIDDVPRVLIADGEVNGGVGHSPTGDLLAYPVTVDGSDIFHVAKSDGTGAHPIHDIPISGYSSASWSADDRWFAFTSEAPGGKQLTVAATDGSGARVVDLGELEPWDPVYHPSDPDRMLIRAEAPTGVVELYVADGQAGHLRPLDLATPSTSLGAADTLSGMAWSPSGDQIAYNGVEFDSGTGDPTVRVHIVNADGTGDRALLPPNEPYIHQAWPQFSPDGRWLLVHRWTGGAESGGGDGWLALLPTDGSSNGTDVGPRLTLGRMTSVTAAWTPDGTGAYVRLQTGEVVLLDPFANAWRDLPWTTDLPNQQRRAP